MIQSTAPTAGASAWTIGHVSLGRRPARQPARDLLPVRHALRRGRLQRRRLDDHRPGRRARPPGRRRRSRKRSRSSASPARATTYCVLVGSGRPRLHLDQPDRRADRLDPDRRCPAARRCARSAAPARSAWRAPSTAKSGPPTRRPAAPRPGPRPASPPGETPMLGLTCLSETLCIAGDEGNVLVSTAPTGGRRRLAVRRRCRAASRSSPPPARSATLCVLSSNNGEVTASTNPVGGSADLAHRTPDQRRHQRPLRPLLPERNALRRGGQIRPDPDHDAARRDRPAGTAAAPSAADHGAHARAAEDDPPRRPHPGADRRLPLQRQRHRPVLVPLQARLEAGARSAPRRARSGSASATTPSASAPSAPAAAPRPSSSTSSRSNGRSRSPSRNRRSTPPGGKSTASAGTRSRRPPPRAAARRAQLPSPATCVVTFTVPPETFAPLTPKNSVPGRR